MPLRQRLSRRAVLLVVLGLGLALGIGGAAVLVAHKSGSHSAGKATRLTHENSEAPYVNDKGELVDPATGRIVMASDGEFLLSTDEPLARKPHIGTDPQSLLKMCIAIVQAPGEPADLVPRLSLLKEVAAVQARYGRHEEALAALALIREMSRGTGANGVESEARLAVATALADRGAIAAAEALLPELDESFERPKAEARLLVAIASSEGADAARMRFEQLFERIGRDDRVVRMHLSDLVGALGEIGLRDEADRLIGGVRRAIGDQEANRLVAQYARVRADRDDIVAAVSMLLDHTDPRSAFFDGARAALGKAFARDGQLPQALAAANQMNSKLLALEVLLAVTDWHMAAGNRRGIAATLKVARENIDGLTEGERSLFARSYCAALAKAAQYDDARREAAWLSAPGRKSRHVAALTAIAEAQHETGDTAAARATLAEIFAALERHPGESLERSVAGKMAATAKACGSLEPLIERVQSVGSPLARAELLMGMAEGLLAADADP